MFRPVRSPGRSLVLHAALLASAFAAACSSDDDGVVCPNGPDTCVCEKALDCGEKSEWACVEKRCKRLCRSNADCSNGLVCEEMLCRSPGCGGDDECTAPQRCLAGECRAPVADDAVAACSVQPVRALSKTGATRTFSIDARAADGTGLAWRGPAVWSVDEPTRGSIAGAQDVATLTGGGLDGTLEVRATLPNGVVCTPSTVENYPVVPGDKLRVVVADLQSGKPVADAKVVIDRAGGSEAGRTDARGRALFEKGADEPRTISVYHPLHAYVTLVGVQSNDLLVFAKPFPSRNGFTGELPAKGFAGLPQLNERVHLAFFGASMPGNILDVQLPLLLGETVPVELAVGGVSAQVPLPSGVVLGLDDHMYKDSYDIFAAPGLRTLWGLGGNADFDALFAALAPLAQSGKQINTADMVKILLPLLNRFQSGVLKGRRVPETSTLESVQVPLTTALRLKQTVRVPTLPMAKVGGEDVPLEGVAVLGGALVPAQGLVPLGLTAGVDRDSDSEQRDRQVNNPDPGGVAGTLPLNLAPRHGGLESARYAMLALSMSFGTIGLGTSDDAPRVMSGVISLPETLRYQSGRNEFSFGREFLPVPENPRLQGRAFTLGPEVAGSAFYRLDMGSAWGGEWYVYFPASVKNFQVPRPPPGYDDRLVVPAGVEPVDALLQAVGLNNLGGALDLEGIATFGGDDLDDLTGRIDAFSTRGFRPTP